LLLALTRLGQRHETFARVTAVEILNILSVGRSDSRYPKSATARAIVTRFRAAERRRYTRGMLTPTQGHHPDVLKLRLRRAVKELDPLTREAAERLWQRWHGGPFPSGLWANLDRIKTAKARGWAFVVRASDYGDDESLKKALQRERSRKHRRGQQTR